MMRGACSKAWESSVFFSFSIPIFIGNGGCEFGNHRSWVCDTANCQCLFCFSLYCGEIGEIHFEMTSCLSQRKTERESEIGKIYFSWQTKSPLSFEVFFWPTLFDSSVPQTGNKSLSCMSPENQPGSICSLQGKCVYGIWILEIDWLLLSPFRSNRRPWLL